jgi:hypothetical protein
MPETFMGIFKRKTLTAEVDGFLVRKDMLVKQLTVVEEKIAEATASRRARLLEADDLEPTPEQALLVERLRDERSAVIDALAVIDSKIMDAQASVDQERDRIQRETGSKELAAVVEDLIHVRDELTTVAAKVAPALSAVLAKLPPPHLVAPERVGAFLTGVLEAQQAVISEGRSHAARITAGSAQVVRESTPEPATPPPAPIARMEILPLQKSKWLEGDGSIATSAAYTPCSPPLEIARAALANGLAFDVLSPQATALRMAWPACYAYVPAADCHDLTKPKQLANPPADDQGDQNQLTAAALAVHSEFVGRPQIGVATVRNSI